MTLLLIALSLVPFYLLGAFPTGFLVARYYGVAIAAQGSGNPGATNVARVIGKKAGVITLLGDVAKGVLGVLFGALINPDSWFPASCGVALVLGHCFSLPPYLKGGKGVATALGVISALYPSSGLVAIAVFGGVFSLCRIVSVSSIAATLIVPIWALVSNAHDAVSASFMAIAFVIIARHEENIKRLIEGREQKFTTKRGEESR
jgi:glycerol-3-phosphate acyltransferase PlsY